MINYKPNLFNNFKNYFNKNNIDLIKNSIDFIEDEKCYIYKLNIDILTNSKIQPFYNPENKIINIPLKPMGNFINLYNEIEIFIKENTFDFMIFHEIGHAVQHSNCNNREYKFNPIDFETPLNYIFNGSANPSLVSVCLRKNYQESYSDCYAGFILFKKYNDFSIFDQIFQYREYSKLQLKSQHVNALNQYCNTKAILHFKNELMKKKGLPYSEIHKLIEKSIILTSKDFLLEEVKTNNSLLKEIIEFGKEFNKYDGFKGFFQEYKNRSDSFDIIKDNELQSILNEPLYKRNILNIPFQLKKTDFGWNSNLISNIQNIRNNFRKKLNHSLIS